METQTIEEKTNKKAYFNLIFSLMYCCICVCNNLCFPQIMQQKDSLLQRLYYLCLFPHLYRFNFLCSPFCKNFLDSAKQYFKLYLPRFVLKSCCLFKQKRNQMCSWTDVARERAEGKLSAWIIWFSFTTILEMLELHRAGIGVYCWRSWSNRQ